MKFNGELKFPEIDHPGVPVQFVIDDTQAELIVEGESLGRWSLFDVRARRLVASAFEIDLDGTEVTFVAADPIDFAYRGVEHMAKTWAGMKSRRIATRMVAVRKSRRGTAPSRIEDLRAAMESNLESVGPRPIAGETTLPETRTVAPQAVEAQPVVPEPAGANEDMLEAPVADSDWDRRDGEASIPLVTGPEAVEPEPEPLPPTAEKSEAELELEAEKRRIAEERAQLEDERKAAEQREANLIEAYRLEVERLEAEREEIRRQAAEAAERSAAERAAAEQAAKEAADRAAAEARAQAEKEAEALAQMEREAAERSERERQAREREAAVQAELERRVAEREAREKAAAEKEAAEREIRAKEAAELAAAERAVRDAQERVDQEQADQERSAPEEDKQAEELRPAASFDASAFRKDVVDLNGLEEAGGDRPPVAPQPAPQAGPQPALAGATKDRGSGLMGAVKAAFRGGAKDHDHQFVEAPGGIGITRYVCEECGYVSISV